MLRLLVISQKFQHPLTRPQNMKNSKLIIINPNSKLGKHILKTKERKSKIRERVRAGKPFKDLENGEAFKFTTPL